MQKSEASEIVYLFSILGISFVSLRGISGFCQNSGSAAAINALLCTLASLGVFVFCRGIFKKGDLFYVLDDIFGKNVRTVIMTAFFFVTLLNAATRLKMYTDAVSSLILRETPPVIIAAIFSVCAFFVCRFGIEAICRYSLIIFLSFGLIFGVILCFSFSEIKLTNIYPVLGKGGPHNVANMLYIFSDAVYITVLAQGSSLKKSLVRTPVVIGTVTLVLTLFYTLCVPWFMGDKYEYPLYTLASLSNSSVIFQRLDGLVYVVWFFGGFVAVGALSLFSTEIFSKNFSLSDRRAVSAPTALMIFLCTMASLTKEETVFSIMTFITFVLLPLVSLLYTIKFSFIKNTVLSIIVLCMVMLSGCYDSRETDTRAMVLAVAVDETSQGREYTFSVADTSGKDQSESGDGAGRVTLRTRDSDVKSAINSLESKISRELSFSHLGAVLFSEKASQKGMYEDVLYFENTAFARPQTHIAVVSEKAGEYIEKIKTPLQPNTEKYFEGILNKKKKYVPTMRISDFLNAYKGEKAAFVPVIVPGESSGEGTGEIMSGIVMNGAFIQRVEEKWFPSLILKNGVAVYDDITVKNIKSPHITADLTDGLKVRIELFVEADKELNTDKPEKDLEDVLHRYAKAGIDVADASGRAAKHFRLQKNYQSADWDNLIKNAVFDVKIQIKGE